MKPLVNPPGGPVAPSGAEVRREPHTSRLHQVWRISIVVTIAAGIMHLLNLVGSGRAGFGPSMLTLFRAGFAISWGLLFAVWIRERRRPRLDLTDAAIAALAAAFLLRGAFTPETFTITLNWVITGAGVFFLVRLGTRDAADVRLLLSAIVSVALVISIFGIIEYVFKANPLFDNIQIDAVGVDQRVAASDQFYRIRSLVGHPGFAGAILLGSMPLTMLVLWRHRWLMAASLALLATALFLTFSRGSWIIAALVLLPIIAFRARNWLKRNYKWVAPLALIPAIVIAVDYFNRQEVSAEMGEVLQEKGLHWMMAQDGPIRLTSGEAYGVQPYNKFIYFDVADDFYHGGGQGPVTIVIHFFDRGIGAIRIDYDSADNEGGRDDGTYTPSASINKNDSRKWTTAAFYLDKPRFEGRQQTGADFRIVDDDNLMTLSEVVVQRGRLKLPGVIIQQWLSRGGSLSTRTSLFPFAWEVLRENPLGVGIYNTPGTDHHAVDSLPLTWMMELGWPGLVLLLAMVFLIIRECWLAWLQPRAPATVLLLTLVVMMLHGAHLMIIYDKPSLVLVATVLAIYASIRPRGKGGATIGLSNEDCMV